MDGGHRAEGLIDHKHHKFSPHIMVPCGLCMPCLQLDVNVLPALLHPWQPCPAATHLSSRHVTEQVESGVAQATSSAAEGATIGTLLPVLRELHQRAEDAVLQAAVALDDIACAAASARGGPAGGYTAPAYPGTAEVASKGCSGNGGSSGSGAGVAVGSSGWAEENAEAEAAVVGGLRPLLFRPLCCLVNVRALLRAAEEAPDAPVGRLPPTPPAAARELAAVWEAAFACVVRSTAAPTPTAAVLRGVLGRQGHQLGENATEGALPVHVLHVGSWMQGRQAAVKAAVVHGLFAGDVAAAQRWLHVAQRVWAVGVGPQEVFEQLDAHVLGALAKVL